MSIFSGPASTRKKKVWWRRVGEWYYWLSRRNKIALWCLLVAIIVAGISLQWIHPAYRAGRTWFFLNMADKFAEKKDYASASLAYRKAVLSGMEFPETWKHLARFLEEVESPDVINVWERLISMEPEKPEYRFKEADAAMKYDRVYQAQEILDQVPEKWRELPEFLRVAADVAAKRNMNDLAEKLLVKLSKREPDNARVTFALTQVQASSADREERDAALDSLKKLSEGNSEFAIPATRKLIQLSIAAGDNVSADLLATKLIARPGATVRDRLLHAQLEAASQSISLLATLANLRTYAEKNPADFEQVMGWFLASNLDSEKLAPWIAGLPDSLTSQPSVKWGLLQYYLGMADWDRAFALLRPMVSQLGFPGESIDLAQKALAQYQRGDSVAEQTWLQAIYAAKGNVTALRILNLLASSQGWSSAMGRSLKGLTEAAPQLAPFWQALAVHERSVGSLAGYYTALQGLMKINPYDVNIASQWVLASALLRKSTNYSDVLEIADRTYRSTSPANADAGTAYAMALLRAGRPQEALSILNRMSLGDLRSLRRAIYVGAILAANGKKAEALEYFARSEGTESTSFAEERLLRSVWEGVANGEATTEDEAEQLIAQRMKGSAESTRINNELRQEIEKRSDPAEVQRILSELKAAQENRQKQPAADISKLLKEADAH
jgi:tetratricopeptide (TPR) repeat protein